MSSENSSSEKLNWVEKQFRMKELGTNVKKETLAGITTFVSMAYILFVNPSVLGASGMDKEPFSRQRPCLRSSVVC